jgi:hypothetical protein
MTEGPLPLGDDRDLEARLGALRPQPDPAFVRALESQLLPAPRRARARFALRPLVGGALAAGSLAGLTLAFNVAGIGPFDGGRAVEAHDNCRTVVVTKRERQPVSRDGTLSFDYRVVKRHVTRCR